MSKKLSLKESGVRIKKKFPETITQVSETTFSFHVK